MVLERLGDSTVLINCFSAILSSLTFNNCMTCDIKIINTIQRKTLAEGKISEYIAQNIGQVLCCTVLKWSAVDAICAMICWALCDRVELDLAKHMLYRYGTPQVNT